MVAQLEFHMRARGRRGWRTIWTSNLRPQLVLAVRKVAVCSQRAVAFHEVVAERRLDTVIEAARLQPCRQEVIVREVGAAGGHARRQFVDSMARSGVGPRAESEIISLSSVSSILF